MLAMAIPPGIGSWRPLPDWNRVTVLTLLLLASFSFSQARRGLLYGLSPDELILVEKAATTGGLPRVVTPLTIDMPIDHFNESDRRTYENRYWVNASYYKEG